MIELHQGDPFNLRNLNDWRTLLNMSVRDFLKEANDRVPFSKKPISDFREIDYRDCITAHNIFVVSELCVTTEVNNDPPKLYLPNEDRIGSLVRCSKARFDRKEELAHALVLRLRNAGFPFGEDVPRELIPELRLKFNN